MSSAEPTHADRHRGHPGGGSAGIRFDDRPLLVFWETTTACDLACRHCRACAVSEPRPGELTTEEGRNLIDELAAVGRPRPILVLTGGDCLKRPDLLELVSHAEARGVPVALAPSVTPLLEDEILNQVRAHGVTTASLSLDGAGPATHDGVRGIPGHFDRTIDAIARLRRQGFTVQVNTTVMAPNLEELGDVAVLLHGLGVDIWEVFFLITTGRGVDVAETTSYQNEDVCEFLVDASRYGFTVRTVEAPFFRRVAAERRHRPARGGSLYSRLHQRLVSQLGEPSAPVRAPSAATRDGKGIVFVAADGDIYPSGFMPLRLGNVRVDGLLDVYRTHPTLRAIRGASFHGPCGVCTYAERCGGSRARALAATGDPLGSDPGCPIVTLSSPRRGKASVSTLDERWRPGPIGTDGSD
jgi:radical SAM protein